MWVYSPNPFMDSTTTFIVATPGKAGWMKTHNAFEMLSAPIFGKGVDSRRLLAASSFGDVQCRCGGYGGAWRCLVVGNAKSCLEMVDHSVRFLVGNAQQFVEIVYKGCLELYASRRVFIVMLTMIRGRNMKNVREILYNVYIIYISNMYDKNYL